MDWTVKVTDIVIALCTIIGPIAAVQAQKVVEGYREKRARRFQIFRTLMSTRALNLSPAHVEAINSVPIDFYKDKSVMDAWEEYFSHLNRTGEVDAVWGQKRIDLFTKLLSAIGSKVGYDFNAAEMNRIYFPNAHGTIEEEANVIRRGAAALFKGTFELPLAVKAVPVDPKLAELQATLAKRLSDAYATDGSLRVTISSGDGTAVGRPIQAPTS
jgi:hypothetical protein